MASAINCSGESFEVEWRGRIVLETPVHVVDGTDLCVTGSDMDLS